MRHTILVLLACLALTASTVWATSTMTPLNPGDSTTVTCPTTLSGTVQTTQAVLSCATGHDPSHWHAPTDHEHGDAPPAWIAAAGYMVGFDHAGGFHGGTSDVENTAKHAAMKGFAATFNGTEVYFRVHAASNPLDRSARFHSYEVFARDPQGGVSHWQGWYDSGDPTPGGAGRVSRSAGPPGGGQPVRPVILVVDHAAWTAGIGTEQWYTLTGGSWSWVWGWNVGKTTTFYKSDENQHTAQSEWDLTGGLGQARGLEATWGGTQGLAWRGQTFFATQFGDRVTGPTDPVCSQPSVKFGVSYPTVCLEQKISAGMQAIGATTPGGNSRGKTYDAPGLKVPN